VRFLFRFLPIYIVYAWRIGIYFTNYTIKNVISSALSETDVPKQRNVDGESAVQEIGPGNEVEDYLEPSMLGIFLTSLLFI
jgi:hypothetical protein